MKRLIIADVKSNNNHGKCTGHYFAVAQNYLDLYSKICPTIVAGGPIFKDNFKECQIFPLPFDSIVGMNPIINKWNTLNNCRYLFKSIQNNDVVVMQHSGASTTFMGIALFAKKKHNVFVIQYDTEAISTPLKRIIYHWAKRKIKGFICPSERITKAYDKEGCIVTDYIYPNEKTNIATPFENKVYDIAIVGSICPDKGVVEAVKQLAKTKLRVLVAGMADIKQTAVIKEICQSASNIELKLGFVSDNDYYGYIQKARYCMLNYHGVYEDRSSGVVLDILFEGTPILGHRCKALQFVEKEKVGLLFDNVANFNFDAINDKSLYTSLQKSIVCYLNKQKAYKEKMIDYLNLKSN